jgi:hypothetical protein
MRQFMGIINIHRAAKYGAKIPGTLKVPGINSAVRFASGN